MKKIILPALFSAFVLGFGGCRDEVQDSETTSATDNNLCENEFARIMPLVNKISVDEPGVNRVPAGSNVLSCPTVTVVNPGQFPVTMYIDYGSGCTDAVDGKIRAGRYICVFSGPWDDIGSSINITLDSFYVNNIHFEGNAVITHSGQRQYTTTVNNGKCSKTGTNPWEILWNCNRTVEWTEGYLTSQQEDDVIQVTGSNSGTDRNGKTFSANITSPVIRNMGCSWIQQGRVELTPEGKPTRTIDFGSGTCDNRATVTINGISYNVTLQ
ncbi:MAG: hypothetical protein IM638_12505 [Bacteroidetes bacterium]|nr:hypothetical protein [Bacteroidota bacterium]